MAGGKEIALAVQTHKGKSRGRRCWLFQHGSFLTEIDREGKSRAVVWSCSLRDSRGGPHMLSAESTSSAKHLLNYTHQVYETNDPEVEANPSVLGI